VTTHTKLIVIDAQSLQAFLVGVLERQAGFSRNRQFLAGVERDLLTGGGAGEDAPDASTALEKARSGQTDEKTSSTARGGA
jgi:hypothetical protein